MPPPCGQVVALVLKAPLLGAGVAVESLRTLCGLRLVSRTWEARGTAELRSRVLGGRERPKFRRFLLEQFFQFKGTAVVDFMKSMGIGQLFAPQDLWNYHPCRAWPGHQTAPAAIAAALKGAFDVEAFRKLDSVAGLLCDSFQEAMIFVLEGVVVALFPELLDHMEEWRVAHSRAMIHCVWVDHLRGIHKSHLAGILLGSALGSGPREDILRVL